MLAFVPMLFGVSRPSLANLASPPPPPNPHPSTSAMTVHALTSPLLGVPSPARSLLSPTHCCLFPALQRTLILSHPWAPQHGGGDDLHALAAGLNAAQTQCVLQQVQKGGMVCTMARGRCRARLKDVHSLVFSFFCTKDRPQGLL